MNLNKDNLQKQVDSLQLIMQQLMERVTLIEEFLEDEDDSDEDDEMNEDYPSKIPKLTNDEFSKKNKK